MVGTLHEGVVSSAFLPGAPGGLQSVDDPPRAEGSRELGRFAIHLTWPTDDRHHRETRAPLRFSSRWGSPRGWAGFAVLTDSSLTADLADENRDRLGRLPSLPWSHRRPIGPGRGAATPTTPPMLWLRHDRAALAHLPLLVTSHPKTLSHATSLVIRIDRREADVQEETECSPAVRSVSDHLDVTVLARSPAAGTSRDRPWAQTDRAGTHEPGRSSGPPQAGDGA